MGNTGIYSIMLILLVCVYIVNKILDADILKHWLLSFCSDRFRRNLNFLLCVFCYFKNSSELMCTMLKTKSIFL